MVSNSFVNVLDAAIHASYCFSLVWYVQANSIFVSRFPRKQAKRTLPYGVQLSFSFNWLCTNTYTSEQCFFFPRDILLCPWHLIFEICHGHFFNVTGTFSKIVTGTLEMSRAKMSRALSRALLKFVTGTLKMSRALFQHIVNFHKIKWVKRFRVPL